MELKECDGQKVTVEFSREEFQTLVRMNKCGTNTTHNKRKRSYLWGMAAEYLCVIFLVFKFYSILRVRYRNHSGEIDIIATRGKTVICIEVKARSQKDAALYSVTPAKQRILAKAASGFIAANAKYASHGLRFDVMVVTSPLKIYHLKNAWRIQ